MTTRWTAGDAALGHYWTLDLGCEQSPERVVVYWEYPNGNITDPYGAVFQISYDGQSFTDIVNVEQSGQILTVDLLPSAQGGAGGGASGGTTGSSGGTSSGTSEAFGGSGGADSGGAGGSGGADSGGAGGSGGADSGGAGGGGTGSVLDGGVSGGANNTGGTEGNTPWNGKARYIRIQINKLPLPVNGRATWAGFWELQVYSHNRNPCGTTCL